jgi:hypothetical protein
MNLRCEACACLGRLELQAYSTYLTNKGSSRGRLQFIEEAGCRAAVEHIIIVVNDSDVVGIK